MHAHTHTHAVNNQVCAVFRSKKCVMIPPKQNDKRLYIFYYNKWASLLRQTQVNMYIFYIINLKRDINGEPLIFCCSLKTHITDGVSFSPHG